MRLLRLLGLIPLLATTLAILLEDAFSKERLNHLIGELVSPQVVDHSTLIGIANDQLINLNLGDTVSVKWSVQLDHVPAQSTQFYITSSNSLYLYSNESSTLYAYNASSGVLKQAVTLASYPVSVQSFFGDAVLVVDVDGNVHRISNGVVSSLPASVTSDHHYQQIDGYGYLLYDGNLLKLSSKFEEVEKVATPVTKIKHFNDGLVVSSSDDLYRLDGTKLEKISTKLEKVSVINSNFVVSFKELAVELYHVSDEGAVVLSHTIAIKPGSTSSVHRYALSDFLVVKNQGNTDIFDLTDYLVLNDINSIKHVKISSTSQFSNQQITAADDGNLVLVAFDTDGAKYNLLDGTLNQTFHCLPQYSSAQNKYYMFDRPASRTVQNKAHHVLEDAKSWVLVEILKRYYTHLGELGRFVTSGSNSVENTDDDFGFSKLVVFYDDAKSVLVALNSRTGQVVWTVDVQASSNQAKFVDLAQIEDQLAVLFENHLYFIDLANGVIQSEESLSEKYLGLSTGPDHSLVLKSSGHYSVHPRYPVSKDIYLVSTGEKSVSGQKIESDSTNSVKTWEFSRPGETIQKVVARPQGTVTSSIGIALADKSVLYKYLYPNIITVLTKDVASNSLKLYIVDGVTGTILYSHYHDPAEIVDYDSISLIMDDNWIVYSYFIKSPRVEQRIGVLDLFDTTKSISSDELQSAFNFNSTIDYISKKSFVYPERILSLSSTQSSYGITLKSIIAVTQSGYLAEIPKYILNSRRIDDRPLTSDDYLSDYKMMPYDPVVPQNAQAALNHKRKLLVDKPGKVLIKPTDFESTSIICYFNKYNQFCTSVQPSSSFDLLSKRFEKLKLLATIAVLFVAYLILKPIVEKRKLNELWIDR